MPTYAFTVFLHTDPTDEEADQLYGQCQDGTLATLNGIPQITFHRMADTLEHAIITAIQDVQAAGLRVHQITLDPTQIVVPP